MAWYTYPRNETLVHQQLSLHQLHHPHPSQRLAKQFFLLCDVTRPIYLRIKSSTCIDRATALQANYTRIKHEYKSMPCRDFFWGGPVLMYVSQVIWIFIFGPGSYYEYPYWPWHKGVCHFKRKKKKQRNIHSLSLALTLTTILSPNHYTTSNFRRPCTQFRLMCITHT